jgi:branched-chain amino acid aminotransferase
MRETTYINYNGKIISDHQNIISADNRSFRYGEGCFETIKVINGKIVLHHLHTERLFTTLGLLQFKISKHFTPAYIESEILQLVAKNKHNKAARVRLTLHRGNGGLYDVLTHAPQFIIQSWELAPEKSMFNENGLDIDFFADGRKAVDKFSSVKSNNYLVYAMAALWAKKHKLNDAVVLNTNDTVADTTIANLFIVDKGVIKTPSLQQGCVQGVMRHYLIQQLKNNGYTVQETNITTNDVLQAGEVFLTNAIVGMRWVKQCGSSNYTNSVSKNLYHQFITPLFKQQ